MNVKICGLTRPEDALLALEFGADALGFIFYPRSRRFIAPSRVAEFSRDFPVPRLGVSVNAEISDYESWIGQGAVDALQLHGEESPKKVGQASRLSSNHPRRPAMGFRFIPLSPEQVNKEPERHLPHSQQSGATSAVTFRPADSIPRDRWEEMERIKMGQTYRAELETILQSGHGSCLLGNPLHAQTVREALLHFHRQRYWLHAAVIMPNHVHILVTPYRGHSLSEILHSWNSFTAHALPREGAQTFVWQNESYDHLVRDGKDFQAQLRYVLRNASQLQEALKPLCVVEQVHPSMTGEVDRRDACPTFFSFSTLKALALPPKPGQLGWRDYPDADVILLDANVAEYGGSGQTVDWAAAAAVVRECTKPVLLSGGLTPENVAQAVAQVQPWGVDVSSGVESAPGVKDPAKLRDFLQICKAL